MIYLAFAKLKEGFLLRGWLNYPYAVMNSKNGSDPVRLTKEQAEILSAPFDTDIHKELCEFLSKYGIIEPCSSDASLSEEQLFYDHECMYFPSVVFSITGKCNFRCKYCSVSAPEAKMGEMTFEQLRYAVKQFKECGLKNITLIGGEPLVRRDFLDVVDLITENGLLVSSIYTNGYLITEKLLNELENRNIQPCFQISFDGVGFHDSMRGVQGAEEKLCKTIKMLKSRNYKVLIYMCLTKENADSLGKTIDLCTELGTDLLTVFPPMDCGDWKQHSSEEKLSVDNVMELYIKYIPDYIKKGFPIDLRLFRTAYFISSKKKYVMFPEFAAHNEPPEKTIACRIFMHELNISPDGTVIPCYAMMGDEKLSALMPNMLETPLKQILSNSRYYDYVNLTAEDIISKGKCFSCEHKDKCGGGCRASSFLKHESFTSCDPVMCRSFESGYVDKFKATVRKSYSEWLTSELSKH